MRDKWGLQPICTILKIAPNCYYRYKRKVPSNRSISDEILKVEISRVYRENYSCYGVNKIPITLNKEGVTIARCTVARLMRQLGIVGKSRAHKKVVTTKQDKTRIALS